MGEVQYTVQPDGTGVGHANMTLSHHVLSGKCCAACVPGAFSSAQRLLICTSPETREEVDFSACCCFMFGSARETWHGRSLACVRLAARRMAPLDWGPDRKAAR